MSFNFIKDRVVMSIDLEGKNSHTFESGQTIRLERQYNELNRRITEPVNGTVISAENIPVGSEVLIHHNSTHEVNRIYDYTPLSGKQEADSVKYFSIPEGDCFAWRDSDGELQPTKNFQFALRVFEPYKGIMLGIEPEIIKDVLYITTGELKGNVCHVLKSSDYEIIFQGQQGREERIIRCRHSDDDEMIEREEIIAISHYLTDRVNKGELLIGLSPSQAKELHHHETKGNTNSQSAIKNKAAPSTAS